MEFKSQICTTKEQSEKLLAAGLKKETADMSYKVLTHNWTGKEIPEKNRHYVKCAWYDENDQVCGMERYKTIPAWSLHRLIEISDVNCFGFLRYTGWDDIVGWLCGLIEKGAINSEYLDKKYNS